MQVFGLIDSLDKTWLKIPLACMSEVGPASQTLAGLLKITNKATFVATSEIATAARVPLPTARRHLESLIRHGWIENQGRCPTRGGRPRRTATRTLTAKCKKSLEPYGILPWWATGRVRKATSIKCVGRLKWSTKAVLAIVMSRLASLKVAAEQDNGTNEVDDVVDWIECYAEPQERFRFSPSYLERQTGLARESVVFAKKDLLRLGIASWGNDDNSEPDYLCPDWNFQVVITPASTGHIWVDFNNTGG